jgi:hypothetical protein
MGVCMPRACLTSFAAIQGTLQTFAFLIALVLPASGQAAERSEASPNTNGTLPPCGPQMDGQLFCKFGTIYECELVGPNSLERRTGWRWKADVLRGCAESIPATVDPQNGLPDIVDAPPQTDLPAARGGQGGAMYIRPGSSRRLGNGSRHN